MPPTITPPVTEFNEKIWQAKRRLERNESIQINRVVCCDRECDWEFTSKPRQRPEIAVVHGKDHHSTSGHHLELHAVIETFVDTIPSREERRHE